MREKLMRITCDLCGEVKELADDAFAINKWKRTVYVRKPDEDGYVLELETLDLCDKCVSKTVVLELLSGRLTVNYERPMSYGSDGE